MDRLTARIENGLAYLVKVKDDEQVVESPFKNTLRCILDSFERLAQYEDSGLSPDEVKNLYRQLTKFKECMERLSKLNSLASPFREMIVNTLLTK